MMEVWDLWFPAAGSTGLPFARCRVDGATAGDLVLVHAAPPKLSVVVRDDAGRVIASGDDLERHEKGPMVFLARQGGTISLVERWPEAEDLGRVVLLPGGEAGVLERWWHAEDRSEWRWALELYNHA